MHNSPEIHVFCEDCTQLSRSLIQSAAYRALSSHAKALLIELKLIWNGLEKNNNGVNALSVRRAGRELRLSKQTVSNAFHELQEKGFLVVTRVGHPSLGGTSGNHLYELTEIPLPHARAGRCLYLAWKEGTDFRAVKSNWIDPSQGNDREQSTEGAKK